MNKKELGNQIRKIRIMKNIPALRVAKYIGMEYKEYNKLESGEHVVRMEGLIEEICEVLEIASENIDKIKIDDKCPFCGK